MSSTVITRRTSPRLPPKGSDAFPKKSITTASSDGTSGPVGLIEGTELVGEFKSSGYREPSRLVCRSDGRVVRLSPVLYAVVTALHRYATIGPAVRGDILSRVADDVRNETGLELTADHIAYLLNRKLAPTGITTDSKGSRPTVAKADSFLSLRIKKAVLPSSTTWFLGGLFSWLFHPAVIAVAVTAALVSEIWLFGTQPMGFALAQALADPTSVLLVGGLAVASAFFHEVGHATACRYGGVRPGPMGCGIYIVWPVFYTDITNSYRLERRGRLRAVLGGVYFNAIFIAGLTILYLWTRSPVLLAAIVVANLELVQQLLPTLRFDGYYIVADLVGIPDLYRYIGSILKRTLLRRPPDARLKALKTWPQRVVTVWVLVVVPALLAQLAFVAFQLPYFVSNAGQQIRTMGVDATAPRPDLIGLVGDLALSMLALLPLAGLLVVLMQALRGAANIVRVGLAKESGEATGPPPGPTAITQSVPSKGWRSQSRAARNLFASVAVLLVVNSAYLLFGEASDWSRPATSRSRGTSKGAAGGAELPPSGTTTRSATPAGDDGTVQRVIDGDSFELTGGERVRLIGVDAPDMETEECFSSEAKAALADLLAPGTAVRLVYGVQHSDQFGRTLAHVYRLPDGLFVNLALAKDGFASEARTPSDTTHAGELTAAAAEARDAGRGLWSSCSSGSTTGTSAAMPDAARHTRNRTAAAPPTTTPPVTDSSDDSNVLERLLELLRLL